MWRYYLVTILSLFLLSCSSTPEVDLTDTKLYLYPERIFLKENQEFAFSDKQILKAKYAAKEQKLDILYEVYLNQDETLKSIKMIQKARNIDAASVTQIKNQLKQTGFFNAYGQDGAFFYGMNL